MKLNEQISIVVITMNRAKSLKRALERLTGVYAKVPIIVVDNASSDSTVDMVTKYFSNVKLIQLDKNEGPAARNIGVQAATTPFVAFSDDDSWWEEGALEKAIVYFKKHKRLGLLQAKILVNGRKVDPVCKEMSKLPYSENSKMPGPSLLGFIGCGAIIRKKAFLEVGGFTARFGIGGEEVLPAIDMVSKGWFLSYVEGVLAHHRPSLVRNHLQRKEQEARNYLWAILLRRPLNSVLREVGLMLKSTKGNTAVLSGMVKALKDLPWVLKNRKVIPYWLEYEWSKLNYFKG